MGNQVNYEGYGCHADEVKAKDKSYNDRLTDLQQQLENNKSVESQKETEWQQTVQQTVDNHKQQQTEQEREWRNIIDEKNKTWDQKIKSEQAKLEKEIKEKETIIKQKEDEQKQHQVRKTKDVSITSYQHHHQYKPSLSNGMYGQYNINKIANTHQYQPSLSNGMYGHYAMNKLENTSNDINSARISKSKLVTNSGGVAGEMYNKIYAKTKEMDGKHKLLFKPECNVKGCTNKPEIDSKLLKGDMYICKQHRMEMADKIKQSGLNGDVAQDIINKLTNMNDADLLTKGQQMVDNDYFLDTYTKLRQRRIQIARKLSTLKRSQSQYWALKIQYKQFQKACDFLVLIRKVANPSPLGVCEIIVHVLKEVVHFVFHCLCFGLCCCGKKRRRGRSGKARKQREKEEKERKEREKKNRERMRELDRLIDNLSDQINDKEIMKNECLELIKSEEKAYNDKLNELENEKSGLQSIDDIENHWLPIINAKKKELKGEEQKEQKKLDKEIEEEEKKMKEEEAKEKNQWDGWIMKKTQFQEAVKKINDEINKGTKEAAADTDEIAELEKALEDEDLDEATWEKKMDRLEKLEEKRAANADKLKALNDKVDEEKKKQEEEEKKDEMPKGDVDQLKQMMQWKMKELEKLRKDEMTRLEKKKITDMDKMKKKHQKEIEKIEGKRDTAKEKLIAKGENIQQQIQTHKTVEKNKLETFKAAKKEEHRKYEQEQDDLNWEKAKNRAEYGSRNTAAGKVACYVVYDKRKYFSSGYENTYGISVDESWDWYGNWYICKFEAKRMSHKTTGYTTFKYRTDGRNTYWVARYNGMGEGASGTSGDLTTVCC